jgi:prepilin-type N-terminal cleavage/methylation domain-containing protein
VRGFTLLELLVTSSIILVLIAISLPQLITMRTRGYVVAARANIRNLTVGIESYFADHNRFPETKPRMPEDPFGLLSDQQLSSLLAPSAYVARECLRDPFGTIESQILQIRLTNGNDFPKVRQPNLQQSLLYFHYPSLANRLRLPSIRTNGSSVISIGPDRLDSLGAYRPFGEDVFLEHFPGTGITHPYDTVYDPTNGTSSSGDIGGYMGQARRFLRP